MGQAVKQALKIFGGVLLVIVVVVLVSLPFYDWNQLRPYIAERSEDMLGRRVEIHGPLDVRLGLSPQIVAEDLRVANAPWGREPFMFRAEQASVEIRLFPLLRGRTEVVEAAIVDAQLALEQNEAGQGNWEFLLDPEPTPLEEQRLPHVERLDLQDIALSYDDHAEERRMTGRIDRFGLDAEDETSPSILTGSGNIEDLQFSVDGQLGSIRTMRQSDAVYPVEITAALGEQAIGLTGHTGPRLAVAGSRLKVSAEGQNLHDDLTVFGFDFGVLPAYEVRAVVETEAQQVDVQDLRATFGFSQLTGHASLQLDPLLLTADLRIPRLDLPDFDGIWAEPEVATLDAPLPLELLRAINLVLDAVVLDITTETLIDDLLYQLKISSELTDGVMRLVPLSIALNYGIIEVYATLDGTGDVAVLDLEMEVSEVRLQEIIEEIYAPEEAEGWFATEAAQLAEQIAGTIGGTADLRGRGVTPREMIESLSGRFGVAMERGSMSYVIDRLIALDLAGLGRWLIGDQAIDVDCMIALFDIESGIATPKVMLFASEDTNIWGEGEINLRDGTIDMELEALPRDPTVGTLRSPILIEGDLTSPTIRPRLGPIAARGIAAAALGALAAPVAGLLGTITTGPGEEAVCSDYWSKIQEIMKGEVPENIDGSASANASS